MTEHNGQNKNIARRVHKIAVPCLVALNGQTIQGQVHVRQDARIKDELDSAPHFLAITDARIYDAEGRLLYETDFVAVNKEHVLWVLPQQDMKSDRSQE